MKQGAYVNYVVNQELRNFLFSVYNEIEYPISGERLPFDDVVKEANNWVACMESFSTNVNVKTLLEQVEKRHRNKFTSALIISFALAIVKARGSSKFNLRISGKVIDAYYGQPFQPFGLIQKYLLDGSPLMIVENPEELAALKEYKEAVADMEQRLGKSSIQLSTIAKCILRFPTYELQKEAFDKVNSVLVGTSWSEKAEEVLMAMIEDRRQKEEKDRAEALKQPQNITIDKNMAPIFIDRQIILETHKEEDIYKALDNSGSKALKTKD